MSVPRAAPVNVATWLMLRFERGGRYYRLHLEQDLLGAEKSFGDGLAALAAAAKPRRLRKYVLVSEF